jgi:Protein of unknown function (DUF3592)
MNTQHVPWEAILLGAIKLLKVFGVLPGAIAAFGVRKMAQRWWQNRAMAGWPATEATIQWGKVHQDGRKLWAEFTYSYFVGEYRSGTYLRRFRKEEDAEAFIRQAKDKRVQIRYDSSNPDRSVVLDRDLELVCLLMPQAG